MDAQDTIVYTTDDFLPFEWKVSGSGPSQLDGLNVASVFHQANTQGRLRWSTVPGVTGTVKTLDARLVRAPADGFPHAIEFHVRLDGETVRVGYVADADARRLALKLDESSHTVFDGVRGRLVAPVSASAEAHCTVRWMIVRDDWERACL